MGWWDQNRSQGYWLGGVEWIHFAKDRDRCGLLWTRWWFFGFWRHGVSDDYEDDGTETTVETKMRSSDGEAPFYGPPFDLGCLRTRCFAEHLNLRGIKWRKVGENFMMRSSVFCTMYPYTIIRVIRSRRMTVCLGHVERVEPMRNA
jgi:hypothetical protein